MLTSIAIYQPSSRPLGQAYAPGVINMTQVDNDNIVKQNIIDQVFPPSQRRNTPGFNASALQVLVDALNNGYIRQYYATDEVAADCAQANKGSQAQLIAGATQIGEQALNLGLKALKVVPIVGQIIDDALNIFLSISQHHALAVQQEQSTLCTIVPAINNAIQGLDQAIQRGQITLQDAYAGLQALQASYLQNVQPILKNTPSACNAACVIDRGFVALFLYKSYQYNKFVASNPLLDVQNTLAEQTNKLTSALGLPNTKPSTIGIWLAVILIVILVLK